MWLKKKRTDPVIIEKKGEISFRTKELFPEVSLMTLGGTDQPGKEGSVIRTYGGAVSVKDWRATEKKILQCPEVKCGSENKIAEKPKLVKKAGPLF